MKKTIKILIFGITTLITFGSFGDVTLAATPLEVHWRNTPLFSTSNFIPGQISEGSFDIKNNYTETKQVYVEAVLTEDEDNLASQMNLKIFNGTTEIYDKSFEDFLKAGPVQLSDIVSDATNNYKMVVTFLDKNDNNNFQGKSLSFDICVGFWGGETRCTKDTVIGPENNSGSGGGGGGSGSTHLVIYNDRNDSPVTTSVTVRWETNKPATSLVIFGPSNQNYVLDPKTLPYFGYLYGTVEDPTKTINHEVVLTGLTPGQTYKYRVVSRASPATISYEKEFTVPSYSEIARAQNQIAGNLEAVTLGQLEISETEGSSISTVPGEVAGASDDNANAAAAFFAGVGGWWWLLLLLLLILYFIWRLYLRKDKDVL